MYRFGCERAQARRHVAPRQYCQTNRRIGGTRNGTKQTGVEHVDFVVKVRAQMLDSFSEGTHDAVDLWLPGVGR